MVKPSNKPGLSSRIIKWLAVQFAGKALSTVLGTQLVTGAAMAGLAYMQALPLAWGFLAVVVVVAASATALNQGRAFVVSYGISGKLNVADVNVDFVQTPEGQLGYGLTVCFRNQADIPLLCAVTRASGSLNGLVGIIKATGDDAVLPAHSERSIAVAFVPMEAALNQTLSGEIEFEFDYGRNDELGNKERHKSQIHVRTGTDGKVLHVTGRLLAV